MNRFQCLLSSLALLVMAALPVLAEGAEAQGVADDGLLAQLRGAFDATWTVGKIQTNQVPPDWVSDRPEAIVIHLTDGEHSGTVSLVPADWIGIWTHIDPEPYISYETLNRRTYHAVFDTVLRASNSRPDLKGVDKVIEEHSPWQHEPVDAKAADASAIDLIKRHCKTDAQRWEAVSCLLRFKTPAASLYREAAIGATGYTQIQAVSELRDSGSEEDIAVLKRVLSDPAVKSPDTTSDPRKYAVFALRHLQVDDLGPELLAALKLTPSQPTWSVIADEINRLHYAPAAKELMRKFKAKDGKYLYKPQIARALVTLRAEGTAQAIQALLKSEWGDDDLASSNYYYTECRKQLRLELYRLEGAWGEPVDGVRLAIELVDRETLMVHVENMSHEKWHYMKYRHEGQGFWPVNLVVSVNGKTISPPTPELLHVNGHIPYVQSGRIHRFELTIAQHIPEGGRVRLAAQWGEINALPIEIKAD